MTPDDEDNINVFKLGMADTSIEEISEKGELKVLKAGKTQVIAEIGDLRKHGNHRFA